MTTRDKYVPPLADAVESMIADGIENMTAKEIAERRWGGGFIPPEIVKGIANRLPTLRKYMEDDKDFPMYLVTQTYFDNYRNSEPENDAEARKCLPGGGGRSAGLRLHTNEHDPIYKAGLEQNTISGGRKVAINKDRALREFSKHRLTKPYTASVLNLGKKKSEPRRRALEQKVLELED